MARRSIPLEEGLAAYREAVKALPPVVAAAAVAPAPPQVAGAPAPAVPRAVLATAVRWSLQLLAERAPGGSVEVRVPPFGVVQVIEGPRHTRGTPPNVVEMPPSTWLALAAGRLEWDEALTAGTISASGARADLAGLLPLHRH